MAAPHTPAQFKLHKTIVTRFAKTKATQGHAALTDTTSVLTTISNGSSIFLLF